MAGGEVSVDVQPSHIDQIKQTNIGLVYRLIDQHGPISRIALSKRTQLAPASITKITRELIESHLVKETEFPDLGFSGRPAIGLKVSSEGWQFLCIRLNKGNMVIGLRDLSGHLVVEDKLPITVLHQQTFLGCIVEKIDDFFFLHLFNPEKILIGSPLNGVQHILYPAIQRQIVQGSLPGYSWQVDIVATQFENAGTLPTAALIKQSLYGGELLIELMQG
ncbi:hypothetical protein [Xenorhabdus szentirmaii]|uniref:hypothetical protein n=1 Tax=Xenorhabdus szentirmaii TaxID=290112 RepID=UPI0019AFA470|nr:hypothetical protein [Xenorhabdus sp. CUL]MBD2791558.1 hypothetical protein [Xenorhabdus sp. CUL]